MNTRFTCHATDMCHNLPLTPDFAADYTPYSRILRSLGTERYLTTQHERDTETDLDYRGARFYDSDAGRFLSLDPMAQKYLALGAYVYVAGNPVLMIDPDGREIWIHYTNDDGSEGKLLYTANMEYGGGNGFVKACVTYLNGVNSNKSGASVLGSLILSKHTFDFKNTSSVAGDMSLQFSYRDNVGDIKAEYLTGGGEIRAAALLNPSITETQKVDCAAHELFHGFQRENGRTSGVNAEVEAYLFGRGVTLANDNPLFSGGMGNFGNDTPEGLKYEDAMFSLLVDGYDPKLFEQAINNFKLGSAVNNYGKGVYKNHPIVSDYKTLIQKFIPFE